MTGTAMTESEEFYDIYKLNVVSIPTNKSFIEWKEICKINDIKYSGLVFPELKDLLKKISPSSFISSKNYVYKESFSDIFKLFRSIVNVGAQSTLSERKSVKDFRLMQKTWPKDKKKKVNLTWEINILILRKS